MLQADKLKDEHPVSDVCREPNSAGHQHPCEPIKRKLKPGWVDRFACRDHNHRDITPTVRLSRAYKREFSTFQDQ
jgi:hypothetical protein